MSVSYARHLAMQSMNDLFKVLATLIAMLIAQPQLAFAESPTPVAAVVSKPAPQEKNDPSYTLGSGDKLRVIVFGEEDLGGEYVVDDSGFVRLPLIGQVSAGGRTVRQLEDDVARQLGARYLKDPRVSIEVVSHRPFYIIGEVNKPGEYPFVAGMSVLNAVAMAGGYTYRANESAVYIRRKGGQEEEKFPADDSTKLGPGDIVNVVERWF
jgi:protein involved in polysaccharide export with SLBB domain